MNCLQASLTSLFIEIYGYTQLEAGLIYLPFGIGCFIGTLLSCKISLPVPLKVGSKRALTVSKTSEDTFDGLPPAGDVEVTA